MRIASLYLFVLIANVSLAQTRVRLLSEVTEKEFVALKNQYFSEPFNQKNTQLMFQYGDSALKMIFPQVPKLGFTIHSEAFVNKEGRVDDYLFELEFVTGYNKDSLSAKMKEAFTRQMSKYKAPASGKTFTWSFYQGYGAIKQPRQVRTADSSLSTVEEAIAFKDTLAIKRLFLHELGLKKLPEVIYRFPNLEELYLGKNELETVQIDCKKLPHLTQLHLQNNKLSGQGMVLTKNKSLRLLNLNENLFSDIPAAAHQCKRLNILWLGGNNLTKLSDNGFKGLRKLTDLNLYKTDIASLPLGIKKMKRLQVLDLYHNKLATLPVAITKLKRLTHLAVSHNELSALPAKIYKLKHVHTLYAHHNRLGRLPEQIVKLKDMKILDLGYNWFTDFPEQITAFTKLEELDLSANNFHEFPQQLLQIKHLDKLYLRGNPFLENQVGVKYASQLGQLKDKSIEVFY